MLWRQKFRRCLKINTLKLAAKLFSVNKLIYALSEVSSNYDALFCDLWGCLHNGVTSFHDAVCALQAFRAEGGAVILLTNAPRPSKIVQQSLDRLNVPHNTYDAIVSSGDAGQYAIFDGFIGKRVCHLGPQKDIELFFSFPKDARVPFEIELVDLEGADGIVCTGLFDDQNEVPEDYRTYLTAAKTRDLPMLCVNPDKTVILGERTIYCAGALARLYEDLGGEVQYFGKPYAPIYDLAQKRLATVTGNEKSRILAIGDGIETDVAGATANGLDALFVTGGLAAGNFGPDIDVPDHELLMAWLRERGQVPQFSIGRLR